MDPVTPGKFSGEQKRLSVGYVMTLVSLCASHATRVSKKLKSKARREILQNRHLERLLALKIPRIQGGTGGDGGVPPRSPLRSLPKELMTSISDKAAKLIGRKKPDGNVGGARVREKEDVNGGEGGGCEPPKEFMTTLGDKAARLVGRKKAGCGSSEAGEKLEHRGGGCVPPGSPFRERPRELLASISGKAKTLVRQKKASGGGDEAVSAAAVNEEEHGGGGCIPPKSPLRTRPKELLTTFSGKAKTLVRRKKAADDGDVTSAVATEVEDNHCGGSRGCVTPGSPFRARPKELLATLSSKAKAKIRRKKAADDSDLTFVVTAEEEEYHGGSNGGCVTPRSPFRAGSKELLTTLSGKARNLVRRKRAASDGDIAAEVSAEEEEKVEGVWQKMILMGDRCEPLDFSGVIYYDCDGRQLKDVPARSPRGSPLSNYFNDRYDLSPLKNPYGY